MPEEEVTKPTIKELMPPKTNTPISKPITKNPIAKTPIAKITPAPKPVPKKPVIKKPTTKNILPKPITKKVPYAEPPKAPIKRVKPTYKYAGKESLSQLIRKNLPKQFIPTKRFATILGLIFLTTIVLALVTFPFDKLLSGDANITIGIGYPLPYLELQILDPEAPPLRAMNFFLDMIIFFLLSYIIDVSINFINNIRLFKSEEEKKKKPKRYRRLHPTVADKVTKKVFKKK